MTSLPQASNTQRDHDVSAPDKIRNPRSGDKGPDMPDDHGSGHRTNPEREYERPDGSGPSKGLGGH